jgi:PAS domain S-box-containing protein
MMESDFTPNNHTRKIVQDVSHTHSQAEELQQLYDLAPCGYHSLDCNGIYTRINQTELKMLGYEWDEVVGKIHFADLLTPDSQAKFRQSFPKFKEQGWVKDLEFELVCKDGSVLPVSVSATVIYDDNGNYLMSRSVVIDISERKHNESERQVIGLALQQSQYFTEHLIYAVPYIISVYSLVVQKSPEKRMGARGE